jgi:hypothetical protein
MVEWEHQPKIQNQGVAVDMLQNDLIHTGIMVFSAMLFLIWILPGVVCRKGKFPEDLPARK